MKFEELENVNFHLVAHLSWDDEHTSTYSSEDGVFGFCDHVPYEDGHPKGRCYRHYRIRDKVYKTKAKFIEALADFNPNVIPLYPRL